MYMYSLLKKFIVNVVTCSLQSTCNTFTMYYFCHAFLDFTMLLTWLKYINLIGTPQWLTQQRWGVTTYSLYTLKLLYVCPWYYKYSGFVNGLYTESSLKHNYYQSEMYSSFLVLWLSSTYWMIVSDCLIFLPDTQGNKMLNLNEGFLGYTWFK